MSEVTRILGQIERGEPLSVGKAPSDRLQRAAQACRSTPGRENPGHTLQPTARVHEAYLRLVDVDQPPQWQGRNHFLAAAESMRRILVDEARRKRRVKHGGDLRRMPLDEG